MQISKDTLEVLSNFASINPNILISPGQQLKTIAEAKNIMASAEITEDFPQEFGIYDLNEFLSVLGLVDDPNLDFSEDSVKVLGSGANVRYFYSQKEMLTTPEKEINMPDPELSFNITNTQMDSLRRASSVLAHDELLITGADGVIKAEAYDPQDKTSNVFSLTLDETNACTKAFKFIFSIPNLKLYKGDYYVNISSKLISHWTNTDYPINYFIALENGSEFDV